MHRTGPTRRWARWWRHRINTVRQHRRARWDRPPEPHDWRWGIGLLGRGLVLAGLAMLGFVIGVLTEALTGQGIIHQIGLGPLVDGYAACSAKMLPFCF